MNRSWQSMLDVIFNGYGQDKKHLDMVYSRQKLFVSRQFKHLKHLQHIFIVRGDKFFCCVGACLSPIDFMWNKSTLTDQSFPGRNTGMWAMYCRLRKSHASRKCLVYCACTVQMICVWALNPVNLTVHRIYASELMKASRSTGLAMHALYNLSTHVE